MDCSRIDVWLKLVCVFKQRSDAIDACKGGHVRINDKRAKPASDVKIGDLVEITEPRYRKLVVLGIPEHSISKADARTMYRDETPERPAESIPSIGGRERGAGRPTKRERRDIEKWRR